MATNRECDGSCGGHQENLGTGCLLRPATWPDSGTPLAKLWACGLPFVPAPKPANICLASEDDLIFPWRDLYPLCGQTVLYDGEEWTVLQVERGGSFRRLWRYTEDSAGVITGEFSATVDRMECRPLGWSILDELCIQLQATVDGTGVDAIVLVMDNPA